MGQFSTSGLIAGSLTTSLATYKPSYDNGGFSISGVSYVPLNALIPGISGQSYDTSMRFNLMRYTNANVWSNSQMNFDLLQGANTWKTAATLNDYGNFSTSSVYSPNAFFSTISCPQISTISASILSLQNANFIGVTQSGVLYGNLTTSNQIAASLSSLSTVFQTASSLYAFKADLSTLSALYAGQTALSLLSGSVSALQNAGYLSSTQASMLYANFTYIKTNRKFAFKRAHKPLYLKCNCKCYISQ